MRKSKRLQRLPPVALDPPNDPTRERQARDDFDTIRAPRMAGEQLGRDKLASTRRRVSPVDRMTSGRDPWLDRRGAAAVERFALLIEQAGYDCGSRGCLAIETTGTSTSGGRENWYDLGLAARQRYASAARAISDVDPTALQFLDAVLAPVRQQTVGETARALLAGGLIEARHRVRVAAVALDGHFGDCREH